MLELWPHQKRGIHDVLSALNSGKRRICFTSPTGGGKSAILSEVIKDRVFHGQKCVLYSNRRLLTEQLMGQLSRDGISFGVRAAEYEEHVDDSAPVQLCSIQTDQKRVIEKRRKAGFGNDEIGRRQFSLAPADLVILDECLDGDSIVLTSEGEKRISESLDGLLVMSHDGVSCVMRKVVAWKPKGLRDTVLIELEDGSFLKCTSEHPVMTLVGWKRAGDLETSDFLRTFVDAGAARLPEEEREALRLSLLRGITGSKLISGFLGTNRLLRVLLFAFAVVEVALRSVMVAIPCRPLFVMTAGSNITNISAGTRIGSHLGIIASAFRKARLFLERSLETRQYVCRIAGLLRRDCVAITGFAKKTGLSISANFFPGYCQHGETKKTKVSAKGTHHGRLNALSVFCQYCTLSIHLVPGRLCRRSGLTGSERSEWRGGFAMMVASAVPPLISALTGLATTAKRLFAIGFLKTTGKFRSIQIKGLTKDSSTSLLTQARKYTKDAVIFSRSAWDTKWLQVKSITGSGMSQVFDIEVDGTNCFFANGVLSHNCHIQKGPTACGIINEYHDSGAAILGVTATPLGVSHVYDDLIISGNNSELRGCGALLPAYVYSCPEIDTSKIERVRSQGGEFSLADIRKHCWTQAIYGHVADSLKKNNPDMRPFLLFAPGVQESVGFDKHLNSLGIKVAHVDGEDCIVNGERYKSNRDVRRQIISDVKSGRIFGVTNRFVLRESVDIPELYMLVLACPIGSLLSYVQICGRVLRAHDSLDSVVINDHGGSHWRHGSPNADRDDIWRKYFHDPDGETLPTDVRMEEMRTGKEECPLCCQSCGSVQLMPKTGRCYKCNHDLRGKRSRFVIQRDGSLVEVTGLPVKPRREVKTKDMQDAWSRAFWAAKRPGGKLKDYSFAQIRGMIASGHFSGFEKLRGQFPGEGTKFTPKNTPDWFRRIQDVPMFELHQ